MRILGRLTLLAVISQIPPLAAEVHFGASVSVTGKPKMGVFHHLDSSGRRNIALSAENIAVAWEDNRDGVPRIYLASKPLAERAFGAEHLISGKDESYEPAVVGIGNGRFVVVWEEAGSVFARVAGIDKPGPTLRLSRGRASQVTVNGQQEQVFAAWSEKRGDYPAIYSSQLKIQGTEQLTATAPVAVDAQLPGAPQLYPALAVSDAGVAIAWEDRRAGHTRLLYSHSADGRQFSPPHISTNFIPTATRMIGETASPVYRWRHSAPPMSLPLGWISAGITGVIQSIRRWVATAAGTMAQTNACKVMLVTNCLITTRLPQGT